MIVTRLWFPVESSENTSTMLRSDSLFRSSNTYFPGVSTFPGIATGALNWKSILLFQSSAIAGFVTRTLSANEPLRNNAFNLPCIFYLLQPRPGQADVQTVDSNFKRVSLMISGSELMGRQRAAFGRHRAHLLRPGGYFV